MDLLGLFYTQAYSFTSTIFEDDVIFQSIFTASFSKLVIYKIVDLCLGIQFDFIVGWVCFLTNTHYY